MASSNDYEPLIHQLIHLRFCFNCYDGSFFERNRYLSPLKSSYDRNAERVLNLLNDCIDSSVQSLVVYQDGISIGCYFTNQPISQIGGEILGIVSKSINEHS